MRILLVTLGVGAAWAGATRLPGVLGDMDLFRVRDVQIHGVRYLDRAEALARLGVTAETSVWGDVDAWSAALESHPLVKSARVTRRIPGRLDVAVVERVPVALVASPTFEVVDGEGARLPLDPARHHLDLPILNLTGRASPESRLLPERVRILAREVARLGGADTTFLRMASEVSWRAPGSLSVRWTRPEVDLLLPVGAPVTRLREGLVALADAMARRPGDAPVTIDLRYADQVVVRTER
jgi:cell division septal protein FtsQ